MKFRKKPIVIEAFKVPHGSDPVAYGRFAMELSLSAPDAEWQCEDSSGAVSVHTLEGVMRAEVGDWIIRGVKGELYPCKPAIFEKTYEAAE